VKQREKTGLPVTEKTGFAHPPFDGATLGRSKSALPWSLP
jgi:hypothetical protein